MSTDLHSNADRILVIRFSSLGDILLTAPALRALRTRFPHSRIDFLVAGGYENAARLIPSPDNILTYDRASGFSGLKKLRRSLSRNYEIVVDLQNSMRSAYLRATISPVLWVKAKRYRFKRWLLIRFKWNLYGEPRPVPLRYLDCVAELGATDDNRGLELQIPNDAEKWFSNNFPAASRIAALCPGAKHATKRWPLERWIELGKRLTHEGYQVVVFGDHPEQDSIYRIANACSGTAIIGEDIPRVAAVMKHAAFVVSNDSGLMHLAAGVNAPLVAIFGPTVREFGFFPFRAPAIVLENFLYCRPCTAFGGPACPEKHFRCMMNTTVDSVQNAVRQTVATDTPAQ